ncbi:hypothetical protein N665_0169s0027 [Sinapis alba]|nr:hypothetical protein N665_0169s0027 [Sinapis alba]
MARWQPVVATEYLYEITFWIRVIGVPLQLWALQTFQSIDDAIGKVSEVDLDFRRVRVTIDGFQCLSFETSFDFQGGEYHDGEKEMITLKYEKLFGYCKTCNSLCHDLDKCLTTLDSTVKSLMDSKINKARYEERASSYKGVVIHGDDSSKDYEKSKFDYVGKGKGKMYEEDEKNGSMCWRKTIDMLIPIPKELELGTRDKNGEIEDGLDLVNEALEDPVNVIGGDNMEMDDIINPIEGNEDSTTSLDGFQDLTDGEQEEKTQVIEEAVGKGAGEDKKGTEGAETRKKQGVKKALFKLGMGIGGTKKRMVQALVSPKKRPATKPVTLLVEGGKQNDDKDPSNPKQQTQTSKF